MAILYSDIRYNSEIRKLKILFSGGGTLGPVMPLLAVIEEIKKDPRGAQAEIAWVGTHRGPERGIIESRGIRYFAIPAIKLRRYASWQNFTDAVIFFGALLRAFSILWKEKPAALVSAGAFVSVPVHIAGWILRTPSLIHQQDILPGFANRLMAPFVQRITSATPEGAQKFSKTKTRIIGNPVRSDLFGGSKEKAFAHFDLDPRVPVILILGGGGGAQILNRVVARSAPQLVEFTNVIHSTGLRQKDFSAPSLDTAVRQRYAHAPFLDANLRDAFAAADIVIARAGFSTLSELASLGKPTILVPLPHSHQEKNARYAQERGAAEVLHSFDLTPEHLVRRIRSLLDDTLRRRALSEAIRSLMPHDAARALAQEILNLV